MVVGRHGRTIGEQQRHKLGSRTCSQYDKRVHVQARATQPQEQGFARSVRTLEYSVLCEYACAYVSRDGVLLILMVISPRYVCRSVDIRKPIDIDRPPRRLRCEGQPPGNAVHILKSVVMQMQKAERLPGCIVYER